MAPPRPLVIDRHCRERECVCVLKQSRVPFCVYVFLDATLPCGTCCHVVYSFVFCFFLFLRLSSRGDKGNVPNSGTCFFFFFFWSLVFLVGMVAAKKERKKSQKSRDVTIMVIQILDKEPWAAAKTDEIGSKIRDSTGLVDVAVGSLVVLSPTWAQFHHR